MDSRNPKRQLARRMGSAALAGALALGWSVVAPATAWASGAGAGAGAGVTGTGAGQQSLSARASELTTAIDDQGIRLDQLSEQYDGAVIRRNQVDAALRSESRALAATHRQVDATHQALIAQAVASYISGTVPLPVAVPGRAGADPELTQGYAQAIGKAQQEVISAYVGLSRRQGAEEARLAVEHRNADDAVATLVSARTQAAGAQSADEVLLDQVKGRLADLVEADQVRQEEQTARAEKALLASEGHTPPSGTGASGTSPGTAPPGTDPPATDPPPTTPGGPPGGVTTTTRPPATAPPSTAPPTTSPPTTAPPPTIIIGIPPQAPGADRALAYARAQLGKPYLWGGAGPGSFDCSGLVMRAWEQAGIDFPHLAQDQYDLTARLPLDDMLPGDLVFYGTPSNVYHVGIYVGGGEMIDAPEAGQDVSYSSIYWSGLLGGGRVTVNS